MGRQIYEIAPFLAIALSRCGNLRTDETVGTRATVTTALPVEVFGTDETTGV